MARSLARGALVALLALLASAGTAAAATTPRVVGGTEAAPGSWPSLAAVLFRGSRDPFAAQFCGGTVISPRHVLTAAHCVTDDFGGAFPARFLAVRVGTLDLREGGVARRVTSVRVHPQYDSFATTSDVALLELARPVDVPPLALAGPGDGALIAPGAPLHVAGWGSMLDSPVAFPARAREADLVAGDPAVCAAPDQWGTVFQPLVHVCAGIPDRSRDSCYGDSGGPLVGGSGAGLRQVGVVSFGAGCARPGTPYGVYANVAGLRGWIDAAIGPDPLVSGTRVERVRTRRVRLHARIVPNGETAFWTFIVQRRGSGQIVQPSAPVPAGTDPVDVVLEVPLPAGGTYQARLAVLTADGVTTIGRPRGFRSR